MEAPIRYPATRNEYDAVTIAKATQFIAVKFLGRRTAAQPDCFQRVPCTTLAQAREEAAKLYSGRPIGIYAVIDNIRGCHVENWEPSK